MRMPKTPALRSRGEMCQLPLLTFRNESELKPGAVEKPRAETGYKLARVAGGAAWKRKRL